MTQVFTLLGFVAKLAAIDRDLKITNEAIIAKACELVANAAKDALGTYEFGWVSLKPETIARKMRGDSPLLETGELRASIEWQAHGLHGEVGSNLDKAVWMEFGTSRIPPRPFLGAAAAQMENEIHKMAAKAVMAVIAGRGLHSSEMAELLHLLKHVGHAVKEAADKALETDEERSRRRR
jgi:HK97 gp10 family phage protein